MSIIITILWLLYSGFFISLAGPAFNRVAWIAVGLSLYLLILSLPNIKNLNRVPIFVYIFILFITGSIIASLTFQWSSGIEFFGGVKRYFQLVGLFLAIALLNHKYEHISLTIRILVWGGVLQLPFAIYQYIVMVPQRGGLEAGSMATDVVAGSFGGNIEGGSPNSVMALFLIITMTFVWNRWRAGLMKNGIFYLVMFTCFVPLLLGETKIAVVMIFLSALTVLRRGFFINPLTAIFQILLLFLLIWLLSGFYIYILMDSNYGDVFYYTFQYNFGYQGYSEFQILNRLTVLSFWFEQHGLDNFVEMLFGHGLGSSFTSQGDTSGHLGYLYYHFGINLTAASTVLWDTGIVGFIIFLSIFLSAWVTAGRIAEVAHNPIIRADSQSIQAAVALFVLMIFYSDSIINLVGMQLIFSVVMGYLVFIYRNHCGFIIKA